MASENLLENIGSNTCQLVKPMLSGALSPYAPNMRKHAAKFLNELEKTDYFFRNEL